MFFLHLIHYIAFSGAQFFNSILAILIITRAGKLFNAYRHVMLFFTLCSMLYSWVEIFTQPVIHLKGQMFVIFMEQTRLLSGNKVIIAFHCATFGFIESLLAAQFFYRYCAMCRPRVINTLKGLRIFLIFVPCLFSYASWFGVIQWGMKPTAEKRAFLKDELASIYDTDSESVSFVGALYWSVRADGATVWNFADVISATFCALITQATSLLIVFFALKIRSHLQNASNHMSARTLQLNRQLFVMLILQTCVPFVLMYTPTGLLLFMPLFELPMGPSENFISASISIYPMIEPLIAMYCIVDFRKCLMRFFGAHSPKVFTTGYKWHQSSTQDNRSVVN